MVNRTEMGALIVMSIGLRLLLSLLYIKSSILQNIICIIYMITTLASMGILMSQPNEVKE